MHVASGRSVSAPPDRREELSRIEDALAVSQGGVAGTVLVEGGAGCGKTELLDAVAASATERGAVVLRSGPSPTSGRRPFGTVQQLARRLARHGRGDGLAGGDGSMDGDGSVDGDGPAAPVIGDRFVEQVNRVATETLVVILVDDLHDVDVESAHVLVAAAWAWRSAKVLLVLSELPFVPPDDPTVTTELLRQPRFTRIRLGPLDQRAVAAALAACDDLPDHDDDRLAEATYRACGGNPLLLRALLDEYRVSGPHLPEPGPVPGGSFSHAVMTCLLRSGPPATNVARALAVLGDGASTLQVSQLLEAGSALVVQGLRALEGAGLLGRGTRLRPTVATVVLDRLSDERRTALHRRAAVLLHTAGAASSVVAHHLLAARHVPETWGIVALEHAAEQALAEDDWRLAVAYLELAHGACGDPCGRTRIRVLLALIFWRTNPAAAERQVAELLTSTDARALTPPVAALWAKLLVSHGLIEEALKVLDEGHIGPERDESPPGNGPGVAMLWARFSYPQVAGGVSPQREAGADDGGEPELAPVASRLHTAMASWLSGSRTEPAMRSAEQFLEISPLTDGNLGAITSAVKMLLHSGRPDRTLRWSDRLLEEAERRGLPGWISIFRAVRAWALLHQGRLAEAVVDGEQALAVVPERRGCMFLGGASATLVTAYAAMGRYEEAAAHLNQPVPDGMFRSVFGLGYLRARGRYGLATDRPHAALADFLRAGELMQGWDVDYPTLTAWRTDAAEAWLHLQEPAQAARLLAEEAARSRGIPYLHGVVLRLTAATVEPQERPALLTQAVEELQASGDRLGLARALADLGDAHQALGETNRAGTVRRRAWHVARDCGAQPLCDRVAPGGPVSTGRHGFEPAGAAAASGPTDDAAMAGDSAADGPTAGDGAGDASSDAGAKLSSSELRVAALAACGHTNQEISARLYVTVSTVEQHLTRVYRKLGIGGRDELPADLRHRVHEPA